MMFLLTEEELAKERRALATERDTQAEIAGIKIVVVDAMHAVLGEMSDDERRHFLERLQFHQLREAQSYPLGSSVRERFLGKGK